MLDVNRLSVREVVNYWIDEGNPYDPLTLERELRRFLLNYRLDWQRGERIDADTPDAELPGAETLVDKDWLAKFCLKKGWQLPEFWFGQQGGERRPRGRPSHMNAILQKMEDRARNGELEATVTEEAHALNDWAVGEDYRQLQIESIRNRISKRYKELKEGH